MMDGVHLFHMAPLEPDPERIDKIFRGLYLMSTAEDTEEDTLSEIFGIFEELDSKYSLIRIFDEISSTIVARRNELDLENLLNFGDYLISYGISIFSVKLGMNVLSVFQVPFVKEICMEFGPYDEFTYYAARILSS